MITVTAFKWVPPFAQGHVRDLRIRWMLREMGLPYAVRLIDAAIQKSPDYRAEQPFGQVPVLEEDGHSLFESGAILLHLAERGGTLLPSDPHPRAQVVSWLFAALNSIEHNLMNLAEVDFFLKDETQKAARRPLVIKAVEARLADLATALGDRPYLTGDAFTVADLLMATVLGILDHTDIVAGFPTLAAYKARCEDRPAYRAALEEQLADFQAHQPPGQPA